MKYLPAHQKFRKIFCGPQKNPPTPRSTYIMYDLLGMMQNGYYIYEFQNSETSDSYRILLNLSDKINLKVSDK